MPGILKRRSTPPILAISAVVLLVFVFVLLNGGGSQGAAGTGLAGYAPADSAAYAETDLRPDGRVATEVDQVVRALTGRSLSASVERALRKSGQAGIDYDEEVEPWLAGPVALSTGDRPAQAGLVVEAADPQAAGAFVEKLSRSGSLPDGARAELVGEALLVARSQAWLDRMKEAFGGESLDDTPLFAEAMEDLPEGGVASLFVSNGAVLGSIDSGGVKIPQFLEALAIEPDDTATAMTLSIERDGLSIQGSSGLASGVEASGAGDLIASFPAGSLLAAGSTGVGESLGALIDAADRAEDTNGEAPEGESGATGLDDVFGQASAFGVDVAALVESLESAGVFIIGGSGDDLSGALVATTSDPDLVEDTIRSLASLGALAGEELLRPLPRNLEGFSVSLPGMEGRRLAVASEGERVVIAIGIEAAAQALSPSRGTLGETGIYRRATSTLSVPDVGLFARPSALAPRLGDKVRDAYGPSKRQRSDADERISRAVRAIETIAAGSAGDGTFEVDIALKE